jgi:putative ABC transport system ATP-binding protein
MSALDLSDITITRGQGAHAVTALRGVSLSVEPGEVVLLEGPSGSGKTTLLAAAAGLLTPDSGEVRVAGQRLGALGAAGRRRLRARSVGLVFQHAHLLPTLDALKNVALQAMLAGVAADEAMRRATQLLEQLDLAVIADRRSECLSGGEEQRIAVARALVHRPAILLADEPTACLDTVSGLQVVEQLVGFGAARGAAVVLATHDTRLAARASRRVHLLDGSVRDEAPARARPDDSLPNGSMP